ncbi:unnamed protein product, partial [marine sediment metagenome]
LPGLIEAYQALSRQMTEQGKLKEARVVVDHIKRLMGSHAKTDADIFIALKQGNFSSAAEAALECLSNGSSELGPEAQTMADALVLAFEEVELSGSVPAALRDARSAIHAALNLVTQEQHQEALAALRPIGIGSMFAQWKLFIKGLIAFYQGDDQKASRAFQSLSGDSFPAKAAEPYIILLKGNKALEKHCKKEDLLRQLCRITGKETLADVLPRAEYLWRVGRIRDSYRHVRNTLDDFPSEEPGIAHTLSVF